jgi:hypothetical protein
MRMLVHTESAEAAEPDEGEEKGGFLFGPNPFFSPNSVFSVLSVRNS